MRDLGLVLTPHTVAVPGGRVAGLLVRDARSRRDLGYIWSAGSVWRWQSADGTAYGERSTQRAAAQVLADVRDLARGPLRPPALPFETPAVVTPRPTPRPRPTPPPDPIPQVITWGDADSPDITAALTTAWRALANMKGSST
jgi:hypothetical protein